MKLMDDFGEDKREFIMDLWNKAADMSANYLCDAPDVINIGDIRFELIHAKNYGFQNGLAAEVYLNLLLQQNPQGQQGNNQKKQSGGAGQGSQSKMGKPNIDDHSKWSMAGRENESFLARKAEKEINDLIYDSLHSMRDRGNLTHNLSKLIDEALKPPKVPYYQIIRKLVKASRLAKVQKAYTKVNKKRVYTSFSKVSTCFHFHQQERI